MKPTLMMKLQYSTRTFITLLLALFLTNNSFAGANDRDFTIHLAGVEKAAANKALPGDIIESIKVDVNFEQKPVKKFKLSFATANLKRANRQYNAATRQYTIDEYFRVKAKGPGNDFTKPATIVVKARTRFGNTFWAREKRNIGNISDPIILNKYSRSVAAEGSTKLSTPKKGIYIKGNKFKTAFSIPFVGDDGVLRTGKNLVIRLKNEGDNKWQIREAFAKKDLSFGQFEEVFLDFAGTTLDIQKPLIVQTGLHTWYGNVVWYEWKSQPKEKIGLMKWQDNLTAPGVQRGSYGNQFVFNQYSGKLGDPNAPLLKTAPTASAPSGGSNTAPASSPILAGSSTGGSGNEVYLTHHKARLKFRASTTPPPTMGSRSRTLAQAATITVAKMPLKLKAGTKVTFDPEKGYLYEAVLDANQSIESPFGILKLAEGKKIKLGAQSITGINLAENTELTTPYGKVVARANANGVDYDILLGQKGFVNVSPKLEKFSLAKPAIIQVKNATLDLPAGAHLKFIDEKLERVFGVVEFPVTFGDQVIMAAGGKPSSVSVWLDYRTGEIEQVRAGLNQKVELDGMTLPIKYESKVKLAASDNSYDIRKFSIGETTKVELFKKGKAKMKKAKKGRKLTVKEGKIVKISLF